MPADAKPDDLRILVTGGAGFIGSALVRYLIGSTSCSVLNVDALTYAANLASLAEVEADPRYAFLKADIRDAEAMAKAFTDFASDIGGSSPQLYGKFIPGGGDNQARNRHGDTLKGAFPSPRPCPRARRRGGNG